MTSPTMQFASSITESERHQIIEDFVKYTKDGAIGTCLLRSYGRRLSDKVSGGDIPTSAAMVYLANGVFEYYTKRHLESNPE